MVFRTQLNFETNYFYNKPPESLNIPSQQIYFINLKSYYM